MSTSTELAKRGPRLIAARGGHDGWSEKEVALIKATCAPDLNPEEFEAFVYVARERGLNPLKREIYAIRRAGKVTHQTGIDGFRVTAARTKLHAGTDDAVFDGAPSTVGFRATVTVWKIVAGIRCPFVATARWEEYNPGQGLWKQMPHSQLSKCAEALALRKAFPESLGGLYTADEMAQADVIDVRPTVTAPLPPMPAAPPATAAVPERTARKRKAEPAVIAPDPHELLCGCVAPDPHEPLCGCDNCMVPGDVAKPAQDTRSIDALTEKISREQQKLLFAVAKEQGLSHDRLKEIVKLFLGVDSTSDIPKANFAALLAYVEGKPTPEVTA